MKFLDNMKTGTKLIGGYLIVSLLLVAVAVLGYTSMKGLNTGMVEMYENRLLPMDNLGDARSALYAIRGDVFKGFFLTEEMDRIQQAIKNNVNKVNEYIGKYKSSNLTEKEKEALKNFDDCWKTYQDEANAVLAKLVSGDQPGAKTMVVDGGTTANARKAVDASLENLLDINSEIAKEAYTSGEETFSSSKVILGFGAILGLILSLSMGITLSRSITRPLGQGVQMMQEMAKGHLGMRLRMDRKDEVGNLANAMDAFSEDLQNNVVATMQKVAKGDLSAQIEAKDNMDEIGPALKQLLTSLNGLMSDMNNMSHQHDLGDIDVLIPVEKYEGAYRQMADGINNMVLGHISVKKKAMACVGEFGRGNFEAPLERFPGKKAFINETIEQVRVNLKALIADANMLTEAAIQGRLGTRADASKHQGDFRKIVQGVNDTLDAVIGPLNVAANYVDRIAKGDIPPKITDSYNGDFNEIKNNLNMCIDALDGLIIQDGGKALQAASERDLTKRVQREYMGAYDLMKNNINSVLTSLDEALSQVAASVEQVNDASNQISNGSQLLAEGANEQASSLEEVSASLEEMASSTRQNAANANHAKQLSNESRNSAEKGNSAMVSMSDAINRIKASSDETAKIVKTIDEIAFQTNLLALNAAVEAARAGDAGKGFAVVAEEVRNLAQRSAAAAKNTADLIEESVKNAQGGVDICSEVAKILAEIVTGSGKVSDVIAEIAAASDEQSKGIEQVNTAVAQMNTVTQQNAANSEESAAAAEELRGQAEELASMVATFSLTNSGNKMPERNFQVRPPVKLAKSQPHSQGKQGGNNGHGQKAANRKVAHHAGVNRIAKETHSSTPESVIPLDDDDLHEF